jgi:hypothetical protein
MGKLCKFRNLLGDFHVDRYRVDWWTKPTVLYPDNSNYYSLSVFINN